MAYACTRLDGCDSEVSTATYVRPKTQTASPDGRRYGGFIVRAYFDGQLQDARATPPELLTLFPAEDQLRLSAQCAARARASIVTSTPSCLYSGVQPCLLPRPAGFDMEGSNGLRLAIIASLFSPVLPALAQDVAPTPQTAGQAGAITDEVIVTGSNIPTAEEVGPQPVDTYRRDDIFRLGVRSATDFVQKLPMATGASINENLTTIGDGRTEIDLRGLLPKETLVLQDGRRVATDGFAGYKVGANHFLPPTVDLNMFPIGLIDHIDILLDGASSIYGSDAIGGVVNVWLIHKFQNHAEVYFSYGNTNLGASNDQAEKLAYVLGGVGDDKTDIVVYAEWYNRDAIYSRDRDISSNADFTRFGGFDNRSGDFAGRVGDFVYQPSLNGGALTPTPHSFPNVAERPAIRSTLQSSAGATGFNQNALTPAMPPVDREYFYGSLDRKIFDQYLELFSDFKYVRGFWDGAWAPTPFTPDVFTDATHPFGISRCDAT